MCGFGVEYMVGDLVRKGYCAKETERAIGELFCVMDADQRRVRT